jgi:hypothetical protein
MGGYDPNLYNTDLLTKFVEDRAEKAIADRAATAGTNNVVLNGDSGGDGGGYYMGGLIDSVFGANPKGPDEGQINVQKGEYVIKKSAVNKYGKGLLDMVNDGKISVSKMKSLLG